MICAAGFDDAGSADVCETCDGHLSAAVQADTGTPFDAHLLSDVVDQLATHAPLLVSTDQNVWDAVGIMREQRHGWVPSRRRWRGDRDLYRA